MKELMFSNFKIYFPLIAEKAIDYRDTGNDLLVVYLSDGNVVQFDNIRCSLRSLPSSIEQMTEDDYKREFGLRLKRFLDVKGWTQWRLADELDISQVQVSMWVRGKTMPSYYNVCRIARVLECSLDDLRYTG